MKAAVLNVLCLLKANALLLYRYELDYYYYYQKNYYQNYYNLNYSTERVNYLNQCYLTTADYSDDYYYIDYSQNTVKVFVNGDDDFDDVMVPLMVGDDDYDGGGGEDY